MFKLIKIDFYDQFACMMDKCPDNCCDEEWDIYVDDETIEKYKQMGIPDLESKITVSEPHVIIKKDHKCPFITAEGLCTFHRDYGEEYLSNTCRSYPRFVSTYGDVYLETLGLSCPATVKQVLERSSLIEFTEKIYYEDRSELGNVLGVTEAEMTARNIISGFNPSESIIDTYKNMLQEGKTVADAKILVSGLCRETKGTPSERYAKEIFGDISYSEMDMIGAERSINGINKMFARNMNRIWLFEHLMLEYKDRNPDIGSVIKRGLIMWILLLAALENSRCNGSKIDTAVLTDCTYKLMRIIDHEDSLLQDLQKLT